MKMLLVKGNIYVIKKQRGRIYEKNHLSIFKFECDNDVLFFVVLNFAHKVIYMTKMFMRIVQNYMLMEIKI